MPAYFVLDILEETDKEKMADYRSRVRAVTEKFGAKYLVVGGKFEVVEGDAKPTFPVILEFSSYEQATKWHNSEEYRELKALRLAATRGNAYIADGVKPPGS
jgi:uncharacterized protein (DUF1330 family)